MEQDSDKEAKAVIGRFDDYEKQIFTQKDLRELFSSLKEGLIVDASKSFTDFLDFANSKLDLQMIELKSERYSSLTRYLWREPSLHQIALSLKPNSFLSHGTAVFLHGLSDQLPNSVYVNREQSPKPTGGTLIQERLALAFSRTQRMSNYVYLFEKYRIVLISGKNTDQLEVGSIEGPNGELLPITKKERTLIDITVRPAYAGGILQVLEAFKSARDRISVNVLSATLKKMNYIYPYHQAIGFLMERAGYEEKRLKPLHSIKMDFDFYLVHGMKNPQYNKKWRLFIPQGF